MTLSNNPHNLNALHLAREFVQGRVHMAMLFLNVAILKVTILKLLKPEMLF